MRVAKSWRTPLGLAAKAAVSAAVIYAVVGKVDVAGVRGSLATASLPGLGLAFAAFLAIPLLGGLRWWAVLRGLGERAGLGPATAIFSTAIVASQVLPSVAGDGLRVWLAARRGHPVGVAVQSVVFERVFMVITLLALALATAPLLAARTGQSGPVWLFAALLATGLAGLLVLTTADRLPAPPIGLRPWQALVRAAAPARAMMWSRWGVHATATSLLSNLNFVLAAVLLSDALAVPVSALDVLAIMPAVTLATTLPISLGGWGVREGMLVFLLGRVGVPAWEALTLSLLFGAMGLLCGVPGLLAWAMEGWSGELRANQTIGLGCSTARVD
jgi:uncharacterized membrane protein YbhN (UPF0104 family)